MPIPAAKAAGSSAQLNKGVMFLKNWNPNFAIEFI